MSLRQQLADYWTIARTALSSEREADAQRERHVDTAFLPAALELMEAPPSPAARLLLWSMMALVAFALLWSILGKVDIVASARGKVIPQERVKLVQWGGSSRTDGLTGVVRAIHVEEGQAVKAGQLLIELDPTAQNAAESQAERSLMSAEIERRRNAAVASYLRGGRWHFDPPAGLSPAQAQTQERLIASTIDSYEATRASLSQQRRESEAAAESARTELAKINETLPLLEQQASVRKELADKGYGSKLLYWQAQQQFIEGRKNIIIQQSNIARAEASIRDLDQQMEKARFELSRGSLTDLAKAQDDVSLRQQEMRKASQQTALTRITAPVDGTVTQLAVHTVGGVLQAAQALMMIVPRDSPLIVEAQVQNRDVGFVRVGQPVQVKLDTYPFTLYGMLTGRIVTLGADAVSQPPPTGEEASERRQAPAQEGLGYTARVALDQDSVTRLLGKAGCAPGKPCPNRITPGMAASVEIRTGERRIIRYLLSPVARTTAEAGRER